MSSGFDVLALFINNPEESFTVSDVMRRTPICWASARDHIIDLKLRGWIIKENERFKLNRQLVIMISLEKVINKHLELY